MREDCENAVEEALGRSLRPKEAQAIEDAVSLHMRLLARRDPQAWMNLSPDERLQQGAAAAAQAMTAEVQLKAERVRLQIAAHDRIENALSDRFDALPENAKPGARLRAVSELLAFDTKGKGIVSTETWAHAIQNEAFGRLMPLWNSVKGFAGLFENKEGVHDLIHELFGERSGNATAKGGADAWIKVTDELRDRANAAGMDIGKLDEWHYPQSHSQTRVAQAGVDKWIGDLMPLLDRRKYINADGTGMNDAAVSRVLEGAYDSIITDGQNKLEPGMADGYGITSNRGSANRAIFFKDADSYLNYQGQYGDRNLWSTLTGHIRSISRNIALSEMLGPKAEQTFKYFNDRTLLDELRMNPTAANKIRRGATFNESLFDYVAGQREAVNQSVADAGQAYRNFRTAASLGKVALTALGDEAGMAATAFANKVPWSASLLRELTYLNPLNSDDRAVAAHAGLGVNGMIGGLNRFGTEDFRIGGGDGAAAGARDFTSKLATGVMHASGAEAMWDARRRALGSVLMSYVGKVTREVENFADLNQSDHGILATKGVTENDWKVWKAAEPEDWGTAAHTVLTPKAIAAIPDEVLKELGNPTELRRHASTMLTGHILEETGMGVMDTGARERAGMFLGTTAGSTGGELMRAIMLFKSFSFSMMQKHWARAGAMPTASDTARYAATLIMTGTVMGALSNQLHSLASGKDPGNMAEPKFWGEAILRGGGLGFYGEFLSSEVNSHDTSLVPALMGPLFTDAEAAWNLTGKAAFQSARGEKVDEGANLIRYARSNLPFLNMWYTQAAFDHLLWNQMQEAANPGYLDRMQAKAYANHGTTYYWNPQENLPSAGPDFAKAWDPEKGREQMQSLASAVPFLQ